MRMWPDVDVARKAGGKIHRTHMVEENKGADHAPLGRRQDAAHFEPAQIAPPLFDALHIGSPYHCPYSTRAAAAGGYPGACNDMMLDIQERRYAASHRQLASVFASVRRCSHVCANPLYC